MIIDQFIPSFEDVARREHINLPIFSTTSFFTFGFTHDDLNTYLIIRKDLEFILFFNTQTKWLERIVISKDSKNFQAIGLYLFLISLSSNNNENNKKNEISVHYDTFLNANVKKFEKFKENAER